MRLVWDGHFGEVDFSQIMVELMIVLESKQSHNCFLFHNIEKSCGEVITHILQDNLFQSWVWSWKPIKWRSSIIKALSSFFCIDLSIITLFSLRAFVTQMVCIVNDWNLQFVLVFTPDLPYCWHLLSLQLCYWGNLFWSLNRIFPPLLLLPKPGLPLRNDSLSDGHYFLSFLVSHMEVWLMGMVRSVYCGVSLAFFCRF